MLKQVLRFKLVLVVLLMVTLLCPVAFARGGNSGGGRHYYRDGRWYRPGWFGFGVVVTALAIGAFITALPPKHTVVVVEGTQYYHDDRYYYRQIPEGGYVVVPEPVMVQPQSHSQTRETSTVNIPNSRGGYTSVTLTRSGRGYIGPQGEYYPEYPTVKQLKNMYGN